MVWRILDRALLRGALQADDQQDVIRQPDGVNKYPIPVIVFAVWLYGTLMLSDRVWGHAIMLFGGLLGRA